MIKAVLFDYGGVLSRDAQNITGILSEALGIKKEDLVFDPPGDQYRLGLIGADEFFEQISAINHGRRITAEDFIKVTENLTTDGRIYSLAQSLREIGIKTGILSNVFKITAGYWRQRGLYDGFEPVILSCEEHLAKPDVRMYQLAVDRLGLKPGEILFIDDQEKCLLPARDMGMKVIKAESSRQIVHDVKLAIGLENNVQLKNT